MLLVEGAGYRVQRLDPRISTLQRQFGVWGVGLDSARPSSLSIQPCRAMAVYKNSPRRDDKMEFHIDTREGFRGRTSTHRPMPSAARARVSGVAPCISA